MLTDLSPWHIFLFVALALLVVGPKDLPAMLRKAGQFMAKLRGMANEFRASFDEMARQSELDELRKEVEAMRAAAGKPISDLRSAASEFEGHLMEPLISTTSDEHAAANAASAVEPEAVAAPEAVSIKPRSTKAKAAAKARTAPKAKAATKPKPVSKPKAESKPKSPAKRPKASGTGGA